MYGPDRGTFAQDAKAWLTGDWEPNEGDGQHTYGDTEPAEGNKLIATANGATVTLTDETPGFSGSAYLGPDTPADRHGPECED